MKLYTVLASNTTDDEDDEGQQYAVLASDDDEALKLTRQEVEADRAFDEFEIESRTEAEFWGGPKVLGPLGGGTFSWERFAA